nr:RNA-directed DNA polymerase, eukaryota, reverse transcriptase zinc-binding domain protein [Tanacetum cinerariifolium]
MDLILPFGRMCGKVEADFKSLYPRIYTLKSCNCITIAKKMSHENLGISFRRNPQSSIEQAQFHHLSKSLEVFALVDMRDRCGMKIDSILCPSCGVVVESGSHVFVTCHIAKEVFCKIANWGCLDSLIFLAYELICFKGDQEFKVHFLWRLIMVAAKVGVPSLINAVYKAIGCLCLRLLAADAFIMISVAYPELWMRLRAITLKLWLQPCVVTDDCNFDGCVDPQLEWVEAEAFIKLKDDNNDTQLGINNNNVDHRYQQQRSPRYKSIMRLGKESTELPDVDLG